MIPLCGILIENYMGVLFMKCYKCGREVPDGQDCCQFCNTKFDKKQMKDVMNEIMGYGENEGETQDEEQTSPIQEDSVSTIGNAIKVFSVIVLIVSIIGTIVLTGSLGIAVSVAIIVVDLLIFMLCYGIGEICCLLKSIDAKMK